MQKNHLTLSLKKNIKDLKGQISYLESEIEKLKKNIKFTKIKEL
jgi:hypothetical protein